MSPVTMTAAAGEPKRGSIRWKKLGRIRSRLMAKGKRAIAMTSALHMLTSAAIATMQNANRMFGPPMAIAEDAMGAMSVLSVT